MRIIAGEAGGIPLQVPKSLTRPTTERVREALFSSLGDRVPESDVLDLYAGSGALGIEALSRGARSAVFVEEDRGACDAIAVNLRKTGLEGGTVRCSRVASYLHGQNRPDQFDLVFADPPYARDGVGVGEIGKLLDSESLAAALRWGGLLVLESIAGSPLPDSDAWSIEREKEYGGTRVSFFTREGPIGDTTPSARVQA